MSFINKFVFNWDPVGVIKKSINQWTFDQVESEADAEHQLTAHLKQHHPSLEIRNQFPHDRLIADILIEKKVAVELKFNLKSTNEFNRLLGQIDHYYDWGVYLIVVIIGECHEDFVSRIERKLGKLWEDTDDWSLRHIELT